MKVKLCLALGKTRQELLEEVDSSEFGWWQAADRLGLVPDPRWLAGLISATVLNSASASRRATPDDFMPRFKTRQSQEEMIATLRAARPRLKG